MTLKSCPCDDWVDLLDCFMLLLASGAGSLTALLQEDLKIPISKNGLRVRFLKTNPCLPGTNELNRLIVTKTHPAPGSRAISTGFPTDSSCPSFSSRTLWYICDVSNCTTSIDPCVPKYNTRLYSSTAIHFTGFVKIRSPNISLFPVEILARLTVTYNTKY